MVVVVEALELAVAHYDSGTLELWNSGTKLNLSKCCCLQQSVSLFYDLAVPRTITWLWISSPHSLTVVNLALFKFESVCVGFAII